MVQILNFDDAMQGRAPTARGTSDSRKGKQNQASDDTYSFWPEVECGLWVSQAPILPDPRNSVGRVMREVLLILGGTGLLVLLVGLFFGAPH